MKYMRDWFPFLLVYILSHVLFILVVQLDLYIHRKSLEMPTILYGISLSLFLLLLLLGQVYWKRRRFIRQLGHYVAAGTELTDSFAIQEPPYHEQRLLLEALTSMRQQYMDSMQKKEAKEQQQVIFLNQWIHQMKTPVSVIELLVQKGIADTGDAELLKQIREENERILQGLDLALQLARLERFEKDYKIENLDLREFVRAFINEHKRLFIQHGVYPRLQGAEQESVIQTDRKWLTAALWQIVGNALKYTSISGKQQKYIELRIENKDNKSELHIIDNGIGIPKQDIRRVFEPFFTGVNGRKTREATGMGLYIAKHACDRLGHRLTIRSEVGTGTTVSFAFTKDEVYYNMLSQVTKM